MYKLVQLGTKMYQMELYILKLVLMIEPLEQLQDPVRPRTPGAEAVPNIGDAALYRQLFTYLL